MTLDVDPFQPANMEAMDGSTIPLTSGISRLNSNGTFVPNGYVATAHIFVDSNGNGKFSRSDAYRDIQLWVNVPPDIKATVVEPTLDVGSVPAGFGIENPIGGPAGKSVLWTPYNTDGSKSIYSPWYRSFTVHQLSNINWYNMHLDQAIASGSTDGNGNPLPPYLPFNSDTVATSVIPSVDELFDPSINNGFGVPYPNVNGALTSKSTGGGDPLPILRSNMDYYDPKRRSGSILAGDAGMAEWRYRYNCVLQYR